MLQMSIESGTLWAGEASRPGKCTCRWIRILPSTSDMLMVRPFYTPTPALLLIGAGATDKTDGFGQLLSAGVSSLRHGTRRTDVAQWLEIGRAFKSSSLAVKEQLLETRNTHAE